MALKLGKYRISFVKNSPSKRVSGTGLRPFGFGQMNLLTNLKFAKVILSQILLQITRAMKGVVWVGTGTQLTILQASIKICFEKDFTEIFKLLIKDGYCVFAVNYTLQSIEVLCIEDYTIINGEIILKTDTYIGYELFYITSDTYDLFEESDKSLIKDLMKYLDNLMNAQFATTENLGAMGILTPQKTTGGVNQLTTKERGSLQKRWRRDYGLKIGKWALLITTVPTDYKPINLPIKDLELRENTKFGTMILAGNFGVPKELLPISDGATYVNREEARIGELINITCRSYANKLFDMANTKIFLGTDAKMNYNFENAQTAKNVNSQ